MKDWVKDYFYYTKSERNGAFILGALILLFALLPSLYPLLVPPVTTNLASFQSELDTFYSSADERPETEPTSLLFYFDPNTLPLDSLQLLGLSRKTATTIVRFREKVRPFRKASDLQDIYTLSEKDYERIAPYARIAKQPAVPKPDRVSRTKETKPPQFAFDPNTLSGDSLMLLGLSGRTVRTLLNYRSKGGQFRKPEDLKKVYGLSAAQAEALIPYVSIEKKTPESPATPRPDEPDSDSEPPAKPAEPASMDINKATLEEWQSFRGIGPTYAKRICGFRDKLGGFTTVDQVGETYGLADSTFQRIRPRLSVDSPVRQWPINQLDAAGLKAHPYLSWKYANAIIAYRGQHGAFQSAADVAKIRAIPAPVLKKMDPYWSFE
jgi:competence ComEA-like helix-hairpin-helix protein